MKLSRREFLPVLAATAAVSGLGSRLAPLAAQQRLKLDDLIRFAPTGQLTLLHMTDAHAQLKPLYYREPSINLGVGAMQGRAPHLTGRDFLKTFGITENTAEAYALSSDNFDALARNYGRVGGMDRLATLIKAIRAERGEGNVLLLDGGDGLQGSYTALKSRGGDMVQVMQALGVEATTGHWEFTYGAARILELFGDKNRAGLATFQFLACNVRDTDFEEPVFKGWQMFEKGGLQVAVIGQAFPHTAISNPRWMIPNWWFGLREAALARLVGEVRAAGADVVVLLSHNGYDVDFKLASRVAGIDVILSGHSHDAMPRAVRIGGALVIASGSHGKFLSRLDLDVRGGQVVDFNYALIPVLADAIPPDATVGRIIADIRAPHAAMLSSELARTEVSLHRRGNFSGTMDDLICDALLAERDAEIALTPGFRWGGSLLAGEPITWEDVYNTTAITYPAAYRVPILGAFLKTMLEDVADNVFNPDPYYQQGGDMVRVGGMSFVIRPDAPIGERISGLTLSRTGQPIEARRLYIVAGWGSINQGIQGPPVWEVLAKHLRTQKIIKGVARNTVTLHRG